MTVKISPEEVASWMVAELERQQFLYQDVVVYEIQSCFGDQFTYINSNGNLAIDQDVLRHFKKLTGGTVVWERGERMWRLRSEYDSSGRQQV